MRATVLIATLIAICISSCAVPPTVQDQQKEVLREMKLYITQTRGWKPDTYHFHFDEFNDAWLKYWGDPDIEMLAEPKKWNDRLHELWVYQLVPREALRSDVDVLFVFVDRKTKAILGTYEPQ